MASNPIERRARQSFLVGFLVALIIMAVVVFLLFTQINKLNQEKSQIEAEAKSVTVCVAADDIKSGDKITEDSLTTVTKRSGLDTSSYIDSSYFTEEDDDGNAVEYTAKIDIPAGTMLTESMVTTEDKATDNTDRIVEYNMISLPSRLVNGDYVDIRFSLPNGQNYIVLSKKYVEQTSATGIWMTMSEQDILTLNSAIVEAYQIAGSNLYAVTYKEPGMQDAAVETYAIKPEVLTAINNDSNILQEAKNALSDRLGGSNYYDQRNSINDMNSGTEDEKNSSVESGVSTEDSTIASSREEYVSSVAGTGLVADTDTDSGN